MLTTNHCGFKLFLGLRIWNYISRCMLLLLLLLLLCRVSDADVLSLYLLSPVLPRLVVSPEDGSSSGVVLDNT